MARLGPTGLTQLCTDIKNWVLGKIPTKTSQLTNDSNYLTSHQSLSNYSTLANTVKSISISGKTITVTPGSGSAYTLTTQDTNTDTLVTQNVSTTNSTYPILLCATANATANQGAKTSIFGSGVKVNPSTSTITATTFSGALTGNVTGNCSGSSGSCTGNAATATQFSANTTVALTGDATGTSAGSKKGWSVPVTLANSGVTAGTYGPSADVTGNNNATISVPEITVDAKGRVTSVTNRTLTCKNNTYNVYNKTLTIQKNGTNVATFTSNSNTDVTANITVPTKVSELTNDSGYLTSHQSLSNYVTLNGTQTISGLKTISTDLKFSTTATRGTAPSSTINKRIASYVDSAGNNIALIGMYYNTNKSSETKIFAYKTTEATGNNIGCIGVGCDASGNVYTIAPTPATADNSTKIATTAFVKAQGYITSSASITGTSANVTGTVAIAHGGTGATTRLGAVQALTNENVGTGTEYFLTITTSWGKAGYCSVANARTVLDCVTLSGAQTITGAKTYSSAITSSLVSTSWSAANSGTAIINSTGTAGTWTALAKMNSTNGHFTLGSYSTGFYLNYTVGTETGNKNTYSVKLLGEDGTAAFPGAVMAATPDANDNSTNVATTAWVNKAEIKLAARKLISKGTRTTSGTWSITKCTADTPIYIVGSIDVASGATAIIVKFTSGTYSLNDCTHKAPTTGGVLGGAYAIHLSSVASGATVKVSVGAHGTINSISLVAYQ